jgi:hypothetical protein
VRQKVYRLDATLEKEFEKQWVVSKKQQAAVMFTYKPRRLFFNKAQVALIYLEGDTDEHYTLGE